MGRTRDEILNQPMGGGLSAVVPVAATRSAAAGPPAFKGGLGRRLGDAPEKPVSRRSGVLALVELANALSRVR